MAFQLNRANGVDRMPDIDGFRVRYPIHRADNVVYQIREFGRMENANFYAVHGADPESLCVRAAYRAMLRTNNIYEYIAATGSMLALIVPNLENIVLEALSRASIATDIVTPDTLDAAVDYDLAELPELNKNHVNIIWACCVLALFKNFTVENFEPYMQNRIHALKSQAMIPDTRVIHSPYSLEQAKSIRQMLGIQKDLCGAVLKFVISQIGRTTAMQNICSYISRILSWNELSAFTFVYDSLVITQSPLLNEAILRPEVRNMSETFRVLISFEMPQYFRYLGPPEQQFLLERSRFPLLITIAQRIKFSQEGRTTRQFVTAAYDEELLRGLENIHSTGLAARTIRNSARALAWLSSYGEQQGEQQQAEGDHAVGGGAV